MDVNTWLSEARTAYEKAMARRRERVMAEQEAGE